MGKERERETSQGKIGDKDLRRCARSSAVREMHGGMVEGEAGGRGRRDQVAPNPRTRPFTAPSLSFLISKMGRL